MSMYEARQCKKNSENTISRHVKCGRRQKMEINDNRRKYVLQEKKQNLLQICDTLNCKTKQFYPTYNREEFFGNRKLRAMKDFEVDILRPNLNNITYRYGGSFAAFLNGASRIPQDIDIEVEKGEDIDNILTALGITPKNDAPLKSYQKGLFAMLSFSRTIEEDGSNITESVDLDISNESSEAFSKYISSPTETKQQFETGNVMDIWGLILNYLDRIMRKGNSKNDNEQIKNLVLKEEESIKSNEQNISEDDLHQRILNLCHQHIDANVKNNPNLLKELFFELFQNVMFCRYN